jgi:hypothetical protein
MSATRPPAFDDRFSTPIEASRRGAHRARPKPASAGLPVVAGIAVVLLVLGGAYVMLRGGGGVSDSNSNLAAASAVTAAAAPAKVDRDIRFKLLNSTSVAGLAKRVKTDIEADGWTVADEDTGNSRNRGLPVTKIYYGRAKTKATAQALRKDLGFGTVVRDAGALTASGLTTSDLAVVLGNDAT